MTKHTDNAFPLNVYEGTVSLGGLTKREYFAAMALQGLISKYNLKEPGDQITIAKMAIELADTFINELNK